MPGEQQVFDAILIPEEQLIQFGKEHGGQLVALRRKYGHLLGIEPDVKSYVGRTIVSGAVFGSTHVLVTRTENPTYLFPKSHPMAGQPRYDWFDLEDGARAGVLVRDPYAEVKEATPVRLAPGEAQRLASAAAAAQGGGVRAEDNPIRSVARTTHERAPLPDHRDPVAVEPHANIVVSGPVEPSPEAEAEAERKGERLPERTPPGRPGKD